VRTDEICKLTASKEKDSRRHLLKIEEETFTDRNPRVFMRVTSKFVKRHEICTHPEKYSIVHSDPLY
jgi:hypothetical protein